MIGPKARNAIVVSLMLFFSALFLYACSSQEISDTIGSCCGATALPVGVVGLFMVSLWRKER